MSSIPVLQLKRLMKKSQDRTIVNDLSLDIYPGEVFGLLGPNGAGKTTTIRMIVGLSTYSTGEIIIGGFNLEKQFVSAITHVGAVIENPEFYKFLSGYKNLKLFARLHHGVDDARIMEIVRMTGLEQRIHEKVETYSLGMKQRLGLAQALLHSPSVLILDEPTNGLDPEGIRELRDYLTYLAHEQGIAVFLSSHILAEMELLCDRVGIVQHGKLLEVVELKELRDASTEVQSLEEKFLELTRGNQI